MRPTPEKYAIYLQTYEDIEDFIPLLKKININTCGYSGDNVGGWYTIDNNRIVCSAATSIKEIPSFTWREFKSQFIEPERKIVGYKLVKEVPTRIWPVDTEFTKLKLDEWFCDTWTEGIPDYQAKKFTDYFEPICERTEDELWEEVYSIVAYLSATKDTKIKRLKQGFKITKS